MASATYKDGARVTDLEVIDFIDNLYSDARRWIKGHQAKNTSGFNVSPTADDACSFCLTGALNRYGATTSQRERLTKLIQRFLPNNYSSLISFNDSNKTVVEDVRHVLKSVKLHLRHTS